MFDPAGARFPSVAAKAGCYESWYLKAGEPGGRRAVWIRYTVHKPPGQPAAGSVWLTVFDREAGRPVAVKQTAPAAELEAPSDAFVRVGELGEFGPRSANGQISGAGRGAAWELVISGDEPPLLHLPRRLYGTPIPRTKLLTLQPAALFSGQLTAGDLSLTLDGWSGMIGHNWGAQHAEQWVWMHATDFADHAADTWVDLALGRIKLGSWTTPWVANGAICVDGARSQIGGLGAVRSTHASVRVGTCEFALPGDDCAIAGRVVAPPQDTVAWLYSDPDGSQHHTLNCSVSELQLTVRPDRGAPFELRTAAGATYEFGSRQTDHGIPLEPFGDG